MGLFSRVVDSFFSSKKKAELKVQKEQEIKDFWIKNGAKFGKILDEFFKFLEDYPEDWIDFDEISKYLQKQTDMINWVSEVKKVIGTYGLGDIELDGYGEFNEKYNIERVYLNIKKNLSDIKIKSDFIKTKWEELGKKVKEFDGNGFEEFEDEGQSLLMYEMENMMNHKKQIDLIKDFEDTFPGSLVTEKEIVSVRLGKEGRFIVGTEDYTTKIISEYEKKKKKVNPNWEPKRFK